MAIVDKFLCTSLENGAIAIGICNILISLFFIIWGALNTFLGFFLHSNLDQINDWDIPDWVIGFILGYAIVHLVMLIAFLLYIIANIVLMIASKRRSPGGLVFVLGMMIITAIISLGLFLSMGIIVGPIIAVAYIGLTIYFYICVLSLYQNFKHEKENNIHHHPTPY